MKRLTVALVALAMFACGEPKDFTVICSGKESKVKAFSFYLEADKTCTVFRDIDGWPVARFCNCTEITSK